MRLFVAVIPPASVLRELAGAVAPLAVIGEADGLRWTRPDGQHITLAFLGEVDEATVPELTRRLARAARRHEPLTLRLAGGGRFGDRTLWAGVAGDTARLARLADSVAAGARRGGIAVEEGRTFRAHLTLARGRGTVGLRRYADALTGFESGTWPADRVELVRSHPPAPGVPGARPRYETLDVWPLGRAGAGSAAADG
jgi:RNA 2',3'-cyclic 3'-phosphodiesterase